MNDIPEVPKKVLLVDDSSIEISNLPTSPSSHKSRQTPVENVASVIPPTSIIPVNNEIQEIVDMKAPIDKPAIKSDQFFV